MMIKNFLLVFLLFILSYELYSSCLACWELRAVEFETTAIEERTGYIIWNPLVLSLSDIYYPDLQLEGLSDFCDTISGMHQYSMKALVVYYDIVQIPDRFRKFPISLSTFDTIDIHQLLNFKMIDGKFDGAEGAGAIPRITKDQYQLLINSTPIAELKLPGLALSDAYWFSYDPSIREEELKVIAEKRTRNDQFLGKIIVVDLAYD